MSPGVIIIRLDIFPLVIVYRSFKDNIFPWIIITSMDRRFYMYMVHSRSFEEFYMGDIYFKAIQKNLVQSMIFTLQCSFCKDVLGYEPEQICLVQE